MAESPFPNSAMCRSHCDVEEEVARRSPSLRYFGGMFLPLVSIDRPGLGGGSGATVVCLRTLLPNV